ncbi:MAG TPA: glycine--tRNA ligase subunit beta [Desulfobulbus sp.]|nr:glycine--tRNA ligase subunit beta [Desulfobulbus sp.]
MSELIFEIGTEEIPAGYIRPALRFLETASAARFKELELRHGRLTTVGTPRRLTLVVEDLQDRQPDRCLEHIGPPKKAGFDAEGNPTKAAMGFARSRGVDVSDLQVVTTDKGEYLMAVEEVRGRGTGELLPGILADLVREMPFPKSMRWGDSTLAFARPIQWLLALYGGKVVELEIEDVKSGNSTRGHRFMAPESFPVADFADYVARLGEHSVIVDPNQRRQMVIQEVEEAVRRRAGQSGARPVLHEGLLDTVTNLVELPSGVCGTFDEKFLELPDEALITSMREHQKYFSVVDGDGNLLPLFVAVNNTRIEDTELAASGHERVLRARLEDGLFFFHEDRKQRLADRLEDLEGIIFQARLGTMAAKSRRIAELAAELAERLKPGIKDLVVRAALLAKADLLTEMVGEFPSLQGIMGREYALLDGEPEAVAVAIYEHYLPVRAGDALPQTLAGAIVGLADRMDTLVGCFAIGEKPTGTKDSFGLRRQAIGLINIIRGLNLSLSLRELITAAMAGYRGVVDVADGVRQELLDFIRLRFANELTAGGVAQDVVEAVISVAFDDITDCMARIRALEDIRSQEKFAVLAGSFKRIRNITRENTSTAVDTGLLREDAEKALYETLARVREQAEPLLEARDYGRALEVMLQMKEPVDRFFDQVMVMDEDAGVRANRLNLLTALGRLVLRVGDISRMHRG